MERLDYQPRRPTPARGDRPPLRKDWSPGYLAVLILSLCGCIVFADVLAFDGRVLNLGIVGACFIPLDAAMVVLMFVFELTRLPIPHFKLGRVIRVLAWAALLLFALLFLLAILFPLPRE